MKRIYFLLILFSLLSILNAQNAEDRAYIIEQSNVEALQKMADEHAHIQQLYKHNNLSLIHISEPTRPY